MAGTAGRSSDMGMAGLTAQTKGRMIGVFKPPKLGVLLHRPLLEAFRDAFPPGVVNTVYGEGREVVGPLMTSGRVDALAFIGTSRVAAKAGTD